MHSHDGPVLFKLCFRLRAMIAFTCSLNFAAITLACTWGRVLTSAHTSSIQDRWRAHHTCFVWNRYCTESLFLDVTMRNAKWLGATSQLLIWYQSHAPTLGSCSDGDGERLAGKRYFRDQGARTFFFVFILVTTTPSRLTHRLTFLVFGGSALVRPARKALLSWAALAYAPV
jgi:hypothetical protein